LVDLVIVQRDFGELFEVWIFQIFKNLMKINPCALVQAQRFQICCIFVKFDDFESLKIELRFTQIKNPQIGSF